VLIGVAWVDTRGGGSSVETPPTWIGAQAVDMRDITNATDGMSFGLTQLRNPAWDSID
jgi:hypothetical protein